MSTATHYDEHLGPVYTWMVGDLDAAFAASRAELDELDIRSADGGLAFDLGTGFGLHSIPLAERGYAVVAIDSCKVLLDQIGRRSPELPITPIVGDLTAFRSHVPRPVDVILCMGDTLTHLEDLEAVDRLLDGAAATLKTGGVFAATFRDYATRPLHGVERFIPVRSDERRILTCVLEYGEDHVVVNDLLHEKVEGRWRQQVSSYRKLRLPPARIAERLTKLGFVARVDSGARGMIRVRAQRS